MSYANEFDSHIPVSPHVRPKVPGCKTLYVCGAGGTPFTGGPRLGNGSKPEIPYATILEAINALSVSGRTNRGDRIMVGPGHTESINAADWASATGTMKGFSVLGIGSKTMRPNLTWTTATSTWLVDTNDVEIGNMNLFLAGAHAAGSALTVAAPMTVSGTGCRLVDNDIYWGYDADQIVGTGIIWTGADGEVLGNRAIALVAAAPTETFLRLTAADRIHIADNYIFGPTAGTTVGVIKGLTTASLNVNIHDNYLHNILASSTIAMSLLTGSTGEIRDNRCSVESGILPFTASIGRWHENYCVDTEGQAGALVGSASS